MVKPKSQRGRPKGNAAKLSQALIVARAADWVFKERKPLSIRGLARHLAVDPMAIYHYFPNKTALLKAMTTALMQWLYQPQSGNPWQRELRRLCQSYLTLLQNHPGLLQTLLSMGEAAQAPAMVFRARFEVATAPLALRGQRAETALHLLVDYLHGFALAMQCAGPGTSLTAAGIEKPLALYLKTLEQDPADGHQAPNANDMGLAKSGITAANG